MLDVVSWSHLNWIDDCDTDWLDLIVLDCFDCPDVTCWLIQFVLTWPDLIWLIVLSVDPLCRVCVVPLRFRHRDHFWRRRPSFRCSILIQFLMHTYSFLSAIILFVSHFKKNGDRICAGRSPQHTVPPRVGTHEMPTSPLSPPHLSHWSTSHRAFSQDDGRRSAYGLCWAVHCLPLAVPHGPWSCEHSA